MWPDGARSATRKEQEGVTCATRVTRVTFDFQEEDSLELRSGNLQVISRCLSGAELHQSAFKASFRRGALKVGFKQKLVPRVTRVAHVPRRS